MTSSPKKQLHSFAELLQEKSRLKREIEDQEFAFKENPIYKISTSLLDANSSNPFKRPLTFNSDKNLKIGAEGIISALLLASKTTRKYFIGYTIAKEMIPFTIQKINEFIKK